MKTQLVLSVGLPSPRPLIELCLDPACSLLTRVLFLHPVKFPVGLRYYRALENSTLDQTAIKYRSRHLFLLLTLVKPTFVRQMLYLINPFLDNEVGRISSG